MLNIAHFFLIFGLIACKSSSGTGNEMNVRQVIQPVLPAAYSTEEYFPLLKGKKAALVINQTSLINNTSLLDTLLHSNIEVSKIFAPEHGFRGTADAGAHINNETDPSTGVMVVSLYGKNKKPSPTDLKDIDIMVFDIQDAGVRFYTYISTLHYIIEACAENNIPLIVLDRPNPLGFYIDGPILEQAFSSFVGMHPIPVVYGMTIGELAGMMVGEKWVKTGKSFDMKVIPCKNYSHTSRYELPVAPSPNLRTTRSILLYPSLCFFEGTVVSVGRGTDFPFEMYGFPESKHGDYSFTPKPSYGATDPLYNGKLCKGYSLHDVSTDSLWNSGSINLTYLIEMYKGNKSESFFLANNFFDKLAGTDKLRKQIISGLNEAQIRQSWQLGLDRFKKERQKYLLYD